MNDEEMSIIVSRFITRIKDVFHHLVILFLGTLVTNFTVVKSKVVEVGQEEFDAFTGSKDVGVEAEP